MTDIVLLEIPRGGDRVLRVSLAEWQGRANVSVREWHAGDRGDWLPGKGATLRPNELAQITTALERAATMITRDGRIAEGAK